jgi:hypothetical protein
MTKRITTFHICKHRAGVEVIDLTNEEIIDLTDKEEIDLTDEELEVIDLTNEDNI